MSMTEIRTVPPLDVSAITDQRDSKPRWIAVLPFVSIVVPCRNERKHIARSLDSLLRSDYPSDRFEILVVDGMSDDGTRDIVTSYIDRYPVIRLVDNEHLSIPAAMNVGTRAARGEVILKADAHSLYRTNHVSGCVRHLGEDDAENTGGVCRMVPGDDTVIARAIVLALAHRFGSGNALVKIGVAKPTWTDSVAFGCFRKQMLNEVGGFDERLKGSSDMDMNRKIREAGGKILMVPDVVIDYFADATLKSFWKHNFSDGVWATYPLKFSANSTKFRHWLPMFFVTGLALSFALSGFSTLFRLLFVFAAGAYLFGALASAMHIAAREKDVSVFPVLPLIFLIRHFAYGLGGLLGLLLVVIPGVHWRGRRRTQK